MPPTFSKPPRPQLVYTRAATPSVPSVTDDDDRMVRRLARWFFASRSQPDVLVALLVGDVAWNVVLPKQLLAAHDERIGIQPELRPWLLPIKCAAIAGLLLGKRFPRFGALTAAAATVYFVIATGYHVRAKDNPLGTAPAVIYGGASVRAAIAFARS